MHPFFRILLLLPFTFLLRRGIYSQAPADIQELMVQFSADEGSIDRFYFAEGSPERRQRYRKLYGEYMSLTESLGEKWLDMNLESRADWILFRRKIMNAVSGLDREDEECKAIWDAVKAGEFIYELEKGRRRGKWFSGKDVAVRMNEGIREFKALIEDVEKKDPARTADLGRRASGVIEGQREALKSFYTFYEGYDPQFSWWLLQPYEELDSLLKKYANLLKEKVQKPAKTREDKSGIIGFPIGEARLKEMLEYEMIPYSPEELLKLAAREFEWCDSQLLKASREMGFGNDWRAAQEKVKSNFVEEGHQPEELMKIYNETIAFLRSKNLLTIPPLAEETWRMTMISASGQKYAPFFLGGEVLQIAYPTKEMDSEWKLMSMRGNNRHFARATLHHEVIAGHHLQRFMQQRYKAYRDFDTPFWIEGWALYWEMLLYDQGFPRGPEDRIGMLFWRMHRCARIIFSLNYHLGKWTPQECIDFLVDRVGHERSTAEGEVRRSFTGGYGPLYQVAYLTGGLQFYALKKELVDSGRMSITEFHDRVLRENAMPVEMVRYILKNENPPKDFKTSWRFYEYLRN